MSRTIENLWFDAVPWIHGRSLRRLPTAQVINPATGELVAPVAYAEGSDVEQAIASSQRAQDRWQETSAFERGEILKRIADKLDGQRDLLARLLTTEQGKP
ncbi:MAG: aldehyde dehydrogenase family protein, partial [Planctomycetota bacterium]